MKKITALVIAFMMVFSCGSMIYATEASFSLEDVFKEAKTDYQISPHGDLDKAKREMVCEKVELDDGSQIMVEGYPTSHIVSDVIVEEGQQTDSFIFAVSNNVFDDSDPLIDYNDVWGYILSTITFETGKYTYKDGTKFNTKRIDCFSYEVFLKNGYSMSSMDVRYFSFCNFGLIADVDKTISVKQLIMTNFPTTSLKTVVDYDMKGFRIQTGVQYFPVIGNKEYPLKHMLVDYQ